jgi:methionyl-tRNA formyltransferase
MRDEGVDLLLNVHSLHIAHRDVVAAPRIGSFNLHPGPLPRYAGLNAPSWAIVNGEPRHAVTLHWMEAGLDTGAIAYEDWFDLAETDTGLSVAMQCVRRGIPLVRQLLETASRDASAVPARAQDLSQRRTYRRRDVPYSGRLDWTLPAAEAVAFVRAADYYPMPSPWGHPRARLEDREVGVVKATRTGRPCDAAPGTVGKCDAKSVDVAAADEWISLQLVCVDGVYGDPADVLREGMRFVEAEPASRG